MLQNTLIHSYSFLFFQFKKDKYVEYQNKKHEHEGCEKARNGHIDKGVREVTGLGNKIILGYEYDACCPARVANDPNENDE